MWEAREAAAACACGPLCLCLTSCWLIGCVVGSAWVPLGWQKADGHACLTCFPRHSREINTDLLVGYVSLWSGGVNSDPWNSAETDSGNMLDAFKAYWDLNRRVRGGWVKLC